ncbi:MAG: TlpA family protein disulfide reductase [Planctomycetota bacterium]|jgi:thiol-disulfide isomerase/thioredoxin
MSSRLPTVIAVCVLIVLVIIAAVMLTNRLRAPEDAASDLVRDGAFGFPQSEAVVLYNDPNLRVSFFNDAQHLYVQAILWHDTDDTLGETQDGRAIGDRSNIQLDVDGNIAITPNVDRAYWVNLWPHRPGIHYQVELGGGVSTKPRDDSRGRGSIRHIDAGDGTVARVDSFLIPLAEIGRRPGDTLHLAYWARSESPALMVNSLGVPSTDPYSGSTMPRQSYHPIVLADRQPSLDPGQVPRGRDDTAAAAAKPKKPLPQIGTTPPEITADDWINADRPPTLAGLRGQVVLIDFWTTNCVQCVELVPHLNDLHERYGPQGLRIMAFTKQSRKGIEWFLQGKNLPIAYTVGTGSELESEYGIPSLPYAFLIGRDGRLLWHGRPSARELESRVLTALGGK